MEVYARALLAPAKLASIREDDVSASARLTPSVSETTSKTPRGTLYRGNEGMWSWVLHRITGVAIFFFLLVHVLDTALIRVSPEAYDAVMSTYKNPIMGFGELVLVAGIVYHALNGLRIILVDFWSKGPRLQRQMLWITLGVWILVMIPGTYFMMVRTVTDMFGGS